MKRKAKRLGKKKLGAYLALIGVIFAFIALTFNFKEWILPWAIQKITKLLSLDNDSEFTIPILYSILIILIVLIEILLSRIIFNLNKPNKKYFEVVDFKRPTDEVIKKAVDEILNSEKTKPYFVHVAPINDEIEQFYQKLYEKGFVWENGNPGIGKTMLSYHALYRYRKRIGFSYKYSIKLFWLKYRIYKLNLSHINDEKEVDAILDELDILKGSRRKIILIDDAHGLSFEDKLRFEFEEEAKEKSNGKFVWINTNYLEEKKSDATDAIKIEFKNFYPKLLVDLYETENPIVKEIIRNKCTGLQDAIKLQEQGKIKDPWHFNFVASNGEKRIIQLLEKLSGKKEEQDVLLLSIFLFSVRNILTGEKEINQTEFTNLLSSIDIPYFEYNIEKYQPNKIISDLGSQEKGRFIIIENKNSLDRGFLQAPHHRLSVAIIITITTHLSDENLIKQMISVSKILLTNDFRDCKYFWIYFNSLGKYQEYFLIENKPWIKMFLSDVLLEQLQVYPPLLSLLGKYHNSFFQELLTDEYFNSVASKISLSSSSKIKSIHDLILALKNDKQKLIDKLNWETLANTASKAEVAQLSQVANFINALKNDKQKLIDKLNWETLAKTANKAEVAQLSQVEAIINELGTENDKQKLIDKLNWETLAKAASKAEVAQLSQVANFINAIGTENDKQKLIDKLDCETLAKTANKAEVAQFEQVADLINSLKYRANKFINFFNLDNLINWSKVINYSSQLNKFCMVVSRIEIGKQKKIICKINWSILLNRLIVKHKSDIRCLTHLLYFQYKKDEIINDRLGKAEILQYLINNQNEIIRFSVQYFKAPTDFQTLAYLLFELYPYSLELCNKIIIKVKYKIISDFTISPNYYKSFSNLLNSIKQVDFQTCDFLIKNQKVMQELNHSFRNEEAVQQIEGLKNLLLTINSINSSVYEKINEIDFIKKIELNSFDKSQQ